MSELLRELRVPSFCPVCGMVMRSDKSTHSFYRYGCCSSCEIQWVEGREAKWLAGWRPTPEQVERFVKSMCG